MKWGYNESCGSRSREFGSGLLCPYLQLKGKCDEHRRVSSQSGNFAGRWFILGLGSSPKPNADPQILPFIQTPGLKGRCGDVDEIGHDPQLLWLRFLLLSM